MITKTNYSCYVASRATAVAACPLSCPFIPLTCGQALVQAHFAGPKLCFKRGNWDFLRFLFCFRVCGALPSSRLEMWKGLT